MAAATKKFVAIVVDMENNAEAWWSALDEAAPKIAASLRRNDAGAIVSQEVYDALAALPGFEDGPAHARTALIVGEDESPQWSDVTASTHGVFEVVE